MSYWKSLFILLALSAGFYGFLYLVAELVQVVR